jgi:hypothetical protein
MKLLTWWAYVYLWLNFHWKTDGGSKVFITDPPRSKNNTCSTGLHFCSEGYLNSFGGERTVIVKINPADVVSIPSDYNDAKGRACRYEVIGELGVEPEEAFTAPVQENANTVQTNGK